MEIKLTGCKKKKKKKKIKLTGCKKEIIIIIRRKVAVIKQATKMTG